MQVNLLIQNKNNAIREIKYRLNVDTKISLYSLLISNHLEQGYRVINREDTDQSIKIDDLYTPVIFDLLEGVTLGEIIRSNNLDPYSLYEFIQSLIENHLVSGVDAYKLADTEDKIKPWFGNHDFRWLGSLLNLKVFGVLSIISIVISVYCIFYTGLFPSFSIYFWNDDVFISFVSVIFFGFILALFHEGAHLATTLAIGGKGRINFIRNRGVFLVYETESYHISTKLRSQRLAVYLSGMVFDLVAIALIYVLLAVGKYYSIENEIFEKLGLLMIFTNILGILWQLNIYVKTDMYNVVEELIGQDNLYEDMKWFVFHKLKSSKGFLQRKIFRLSKFIFNIDSIREESNKLSSMSQHDLYIIRRYSYFVFVGIVVSTVMFFVFNVRRDFEYIYLSFYSIISAIPNIDPMKFWKEIGIIVVVFQYYVFLLISFYRSFISSRIHNKLLTKTFEN